MSNRSPASPDGWPKLYPLELEGRRTVIAEVSPIQLADVQPVLEAYKGLSDKSLYSRFFTVPNELPYDHLFDRIRHLDHKTREALIAKVGGQVIGAANYAPVPGEPGVVEAAVVIADDMQCNGLGSFMFTCLMRLARDRGNKKLVAEYLRTNDAIKGLLAKVAGQPLAEEDHGISKRAVYDLNDIAKRS